MSFIGSMLGDSTGAGFQAQGASPQQQQTAYNQTQTGLQNQQAFINALQAQNGIGNQSSVFAQQQALANQLQNVANGTGPNPAQAQLAQATGANTANQAALMAGQRGSNANVGLLARQAAQQGAANQQQAAGQGATLQAQQSLAAMQQLQNQQASMGNLANTQVGEQQNALSNYNQTALGQQSNLLGLQQEVNSANAQIAGANVAGQQNLLGGLMGGIGAGLMLGGGVPKYADGTLQVGANPLMQQNAPQQVTPVSSQPQSSNGPSSIAARMMTGMSNAMTSGSKSPMTAGVNSLVSGIGHLFSSSTPAPTGNGPAGWEAASGLGPATSYEGWQTDSGLGYAGGGKVPALVSPGEKYLSPEDVEKVKKTGKNPMEVGKTIPGKPKVGGAKNSYANDTVLATLEEGGIVLPRSVTATPYRTQSVSQSA